jgi:hypothetical protein
LCEELGNQRIAQKGGLVSNSSITIQGARGEHYSSGNLESHEK